jgi:phosphopantetheinyl transferase (holo-ACP synthase)
LSKYKIFLSLSDEKKHSIAYVIINKQKWPKNL